MVTKKHSASGRLLSGILVCLILSAGCGAEVGLEQKTLDALNAAIETLESQPAEWKSALRGVIDEFDKSQRQIIKEAAREVRNLLAEAEAQIQTQIQCLIDSLVDRVRDHLVRLRDRLLGMTPTAVTAGICQFVPQSLQLEEVGGRLRSREGLIFAYGYNFSPDRLPKIRLVDGNGNGVTEYSVRAKYTTRYQLTVDVQGIDFSGVLPNMALQFVWDEGPRSAEMGILLPATHSAKTWVRIARKSLSITARAGDHSTRLDILPQDKLGISCSGEATIKLDAPGMRGKSHRVGPEGFPGISLNDRNMPMPGQLLGAIVGKLGSEGTYFLIGRDYDDTYQASEEVPKRFYLRTNYYPGQGLVNSFAGGFTCRIVQDRYQ